jgi:hypothetical protein
MSLRFNSPLPSRGRVPEGRVRVVPRTLHSPHPALCATFSRKGRGDRLRGL